MPVGNVNSTERGSGARYNDGKPDLSLIPPTFLPEGNEKHGRLLLSLEQLMFNGTEQGVMQWREDEMEQSYDVCAKVFEYGKRKYAAWNWAKGMAWSIPIACALRHAHALYVEGELLDPESGLPHIGHILCNLIMIEYFINWYPEGNDLPYKVLNSAAA